MFLEEKQNEMRDYLRNNQVKYTKTPFLDGFLFNIQTSKKQLSLPKFKDDNSGKSLSALLQDYNSYLLVKPSENLEDSDIGKEIAELKSKIASSEDYNRENWLELFQYLGWENRQDEIWPLLEQKYSKDKSSVYVKLSSEFTTQSDYPNLETRKRWMLRQIDLNPENIKLRKDFIAYFGSGTEVQLTRNELLGLINNAESDEDRFSYLLLLNEKYPDAAFNLVKDIEPCREDFKLAASIHFLDPC